MSQDLKIILKYKLEREKQEKMKYEHWGSRGKVDGLDIFVYINHFV